MKRAIIVMGPPGSGKNTQAEFISQELGVPHLDTGDMYRRLIKAGEFSGDRIAKGLLMDDETTLSLAKKNIVELTDNHAKGVILTGAPRTLTQAFGAKRDNGLVGWLSEKYGQENLLFIVIDLPAGDAIDRNIKRGEGRADDKSEIMKTRLEVYRNKTEPIITRAKERGYKVFHVDGCPSREEVFAQIKKHLS